jgi:uncharacterized protein (TIGR03118 family)
MKHAVRLLTSFRARAAASVLLAAGIVAAGGGLVRANDFAQANLVSDVPNLALHTDAVLKNAWGLSHGPNTPFWISDAGSNLSTLYDGTGSPVALQVAIPGPASVPGVPAVPTGNLFNPTPGFLVLSGVPASKALFIFAGATGTISAWSPAVDQHHAILKVDNFTSGASYTGIALGTNSGGTFLLAANFTQARIDVFDSSFAPATLAGTFSDPMVPAGFGPFNIENIDGLLFVTYAMIGADGRDVPGVGNGYVAIFDSNGMLVRHFTSQGMLNAPWGMAIAPASFENAAGDLLVGNFGDGRINVFRLSDGRFRGQLKIDGQPVVIPGLWALVDGAGARNADLNKVYFTAGINHEEDGLFGSLGAAVDETGPDQ